MRLSEKAASFFWRKKGWKALKWKNEEERESGFQEVCAGADDVAAAEL
jgi:hypothetical protein